MSAFFQSMVFDKEKSKIKILTNNKLFKAQHQFSQAETNLLPKISIILSFLCFSPA